MDFRQLKYFLRVVEEGAISSAAKQIPIAQPALTRQLRMLEDNVGATLLLRSRQGIKLTAAGETFHSEVSRLLREFEQTKQNARRIAAGKLGQLRLGVTVMHLWSPQIVQLLNEFREQYSDVTLKIMSLLSAPQIKALKRQQLDAGLLFFPPQDDTDLCSHKLYEDRLVLVTSVGSRLASDPPRRLADLNGEDFIWFDRSATPAYHDKLIHAFQRRGFTPHVVQEGTDNATMLCLVAAGMGCTILPERTMLGASRDVVCHQIEDLDLILPLELVWRRDTSLPAVHRLIDVAESILTTDAKDVVPRAGRFTQRDSR